LLAKRIAKIHLDTPIDQMAAARLQGAPVMLIWLLVLLAASADALSVKGHKRIASGFVTTHGEIKEVPGFDGPLPSK
jgi:hypothetical protein